MTMSSLPEAIENYRYDNEPSWKQLMAQEAWKRAKRILRSDEASIKARWEAQKYEKYINDPVGFCEDVLGDRFTDDVKEVMRSVCDNRITIARSANAVGKSYAAARIAIWFYKVFPDAKVILAAAPPVENLRKILWGQLVNIVKKNPHLFINDTLRVNTLSRHDESYIAAVSIPTSGTAAAREARFCTDADDVFEMLDGTLVPYRNLIDKKIEVVSVDRRFNKTIAKASFFYNGIDEIYEIVLANGVKLSRTKEHPLYVAKLKESKLGVYADKERWKDASKVKAGDFLLVPKDTSFNFGTRVSHKEKIEETAASIASKSAEENTRVPQYINNLSKQYIALFLNKLYSSNGSVFFEHNSSDSIVYRSKSEYLVRDIQRLLHRFGIRSVVQKDSDEEWSLSISGKENIINFAFDVGIDGKEAILREFIKSDRYDDSSYTKEPSWMNSDYEGFRWERVESVKKVGRRPTVGVHVENEYHTYLTNVVEHNSGKHSPHLLFIVDEGDAVYDEVYRGIESCMSGGMSRLLVMFNPRVQTGFVYQKERDGQATVIKLSALNHPNVITGRDVIPGAVTRDTVIRRINEWTQPLAPYEEPREEHFKVPDFLVGCQASTQEGKSYPPLEPGYRKITDIAFSYMVLGEYPSEGLNRLISLDWIALARSRWDAYVSEHGERPPQGAVPILGMDLGEYGTDANVICARYGGFVSRLDVWSGVDVATSIQKAIEAVHKYKPQAIMVDATGIGASVAPSIAREIRDKDFRAIGVKVANAPSRGIRTDQGQFYMLRDQLWWAVREWLRTDPGAMLPPDEKLCEELAAVDYEKDVFGRIKVSNKDQIRKTIKRSSDRADALCLTFFPMVKPTFIRLDV